MTRRLVVVAPVPSNDDVSSPATVGALPCMFAHNASDATFHNRPVQLVRSA